MKTFIYFMLYLLFILVFLLGVAVGVDMEIAKRDYNKALENGDYDKPITGCIFEQVCNLYTKRLFDK